jgi:hypothetical protein
VAPEKSLLGLLAAVFVIVWAPTDVTRLGAVERTLYSGFTFALLLSAFLWLESLRRRSWTLLALALVVGLVTARSYEGTIPLLLVTPLLALPLRKDLSRLRTWSVTWELALGVALIHAARPVLFPGPEASYQTSVLGLDAHPGHVLQRLVQQYSLHLLPLFHAHLADLLVAPVGIAVLVFLLCFVLVSRHAPEDRDSRRPDLALALVGSFALTILCYGLVTFSAHLATPSRMQYLSAPGMGVFLASAVYLGASILGRSRRPLVAALAAWVVAVGTLRTVWLQKGWDARSYFPAQSAALRGLTRLAPDLAPGTVVILLDEDRAWPATFAFRHAVEYLYQGRAVGYVFGAWDGMFPTTFEEAGMRCTPWPAVQRSWGSPATVYSYDQAIVVREVGGAVGLLDSWPAELPRRTAAERYAPRERIVVANPPPERAILDLR